MKKRLIMLAFFLLLFTAACTQAGMIEPGAKVGDFLITTGEKGNFKYGFEVECSDPSPDNSYICNVAVGQAINVSTGIYDDTNSGNLNEVWEKSKYQIYINDKLVDLKAFGTVEYNHPQVGIIRFADVVITAEKPGEITVRDTGFYDNGDPFSSTSTYVFSNP